MGLGALQGSLPPIKRFSFLLGKRSYHLPTSPLSESAVSLEYCSTPSCLVNVSFSFWFRHHMFVLLSSLNAQ